MKTNQVRYLLRLPYKVHERLKVTAEHLGESLNTLCVRLLEGGVVSSSSGTSSALLPTIGNSIVSAALLQKIVQVFKAEIQGVVLFGSAARGSMQDSSDIDLLIVLSENTPITRELYTEWDREIYTQRGGISWALGHEVTPQFVKLPGEFSDIGGLWCEVALDGVVLYDPTLAVSQALQKIRKRIMAGEFERREAGGQPYWTKHLLSAA